MVLDESASSESGKSGKIKNVPFPQSPEVINIFIS